MITLHCLWAKSNNRMRGQFECDVTWFCFCFKFVVHMHDAVVVPFFVYILKLCKYSRFIAKFVIKAWLITDIKDLITYNSHPWIMFSFNWLVIICRGKGGGSFEIGRPRSTGWKDFGRKWTRGVGGSWKLDNFHGRHMYIISYNIYSSHITNKDVSKFEKRFRKLKSCCHHWVFGHPQWWKCSATPSFSIWEKQYRNLNTGQWIDFRKQHYVKIEFVYYLEYLRL